MKTHKKPFKKKEKSFDCLASLISSPVNPTKRNQSRGVGKGQSCSTKFFSSLSLSLPPLESQSPLAPSPGLRGGLAPVSLFILVTYSCVARMGYVPIHGSRLELSAGVACAVIKCVVVALFVLNFGSHPCTVLKPTRCSATASLRSAVTTGAHAPTSCAYAR